ncbi:thiamine phosphate synthase [Chitinophaga sp. XS-30]|uniref:thiamine phosphate synthase n=1 Tax=Chitinophaga sp. XS-30 TaxID=2604421 RepID=UPI0011DD1A75|nr:thiamine phosphate synthase [Chitinophaga sp. XS-30]QEH40064.1 thiamine phosphate synthase [Chitinophaga sp. XS-30]
MIWVITSPERIYEEVERINQLMTVADVLLLRKPGWMEEEYAALLEQLRPAFRNRIMIGEQPALVQQYGLMGLHLSEKKRLQASPGELSDYAALGVPLSTSIHRPVCPGKMWRHLLLGPVFDSISKPGYAGNSAVTKNIPSNAVAIGGVNAANVGTVRSMGFSGAAVLGAIWQERYDPAEVYRQIKTAWVAGR